MADAQDSVTTVDEPRDKPKGRFGFGRRKDKDEARSETEWVDTLRAQDEARQEDAPAISPFAASPEPEPEPALDPSALGALPEAEEAHTPDEEPSPDAATFANGDSESVYEKSWTRRRHEEMDDIHHFVDNVIGTSLDPARRRRITSHELGIQDRTPQREKAPRPIRVEGIDEELMIAFTFPPEEFRGARVVYETEGGYVLEVQRAVHNDDKRTTHQYYTVSRVGDVAHVLDKMRARELERDQAALQRQTRADPTAPQDPPRLEAPEATERLPETASEPDDDSAGTATEPLPESFTQPSGDHGADSEPEVERVDTPPPHPEPDPAPRGAEAPQVDVAEVSAPAVEEPPAEEPAKRGLFGRRKGDSEPDADAPEDEPADETRKRGLFHRRKDADADEAPEAEETGDEARKRGIFRFKKGSDEVEEDA